MNKRERQYLAAYIRDMTKDELVSWIMILLDQFSPEEVSHYLEEDLFIAGYYDHQPFGFSREENNE